jgi:hypothetical protein
VHECAYSMCLDCEACTNGPFVNILLGVRSESNGGVRSHSNKLGVPYIFDRWTLEPLGVSGHLPTALAILYMQLRFLA